MAKQILNIGTFPNDRTGDPLRTAMIKIKNNFDELYDSVPENLTDLNIADGANGQILTTDGNGSFSFTSAAGLQGTQGVQGSAGVGTQGVQGSAGSAGVGTQGVQGSIGSQGFQGAANGPAGPQGTQGTQGSAGVGTQGFQGFQGFQGNIGSGITSVVVDTTPQLGGPLDAQSYNIINVSELRAPDDGTQLFIGGPNSTSANGGDIRIRGGAGFGVGNLGGDVYIEGGYPTNGATLYGDVRIGAPGGSVYIQGIQYPSTDGTNGKVLTTDGSGTLFFSGPYISLTDLKNVVAASADFTDFQSRIAAL